MIYCVLLNPSIDVIYSLQELVPGTTETDVPSQFFPAGKALNAARVVRALGEAVTVIGLMPRLSRPVFDAFCRKAGIATEFYQVEGMARVNATVLEKSSDQTTHLSSRGPRFAPRIQDEFVEFAVSRMSSGDTWVFAGSVPSGFESNIYRTLVRECRKRGIVTLLDARADALKLGVRAKPDVLKPNLAELEGYYGEQIEGIRHIALKAKRFLDMGIAYVFVSLGADGLIAIHENDCLLCTVPPVKVVDTVGCGDALVAGLVVGMQRKFSFTETCRLAAACGVSNAMHAGAGSVRREEVSQIMEEIAIENA